MFDYHPDGALPNFGRKNVASLILSSWLQSLKSWSLRQIRGLLQIAYELGIGETTVKAHMTQVLRKLAFSNRTQVVAALSAVG